MSDLLYRDYNTNADFYDIFNKYRNYKIECMYLLEILKNKKYVLDVGCATGVHLCILENLGYKVSGLDISRKLLNVARTKTDAKLYEMNLLDMNIDEKYDAIICMKSVLNQLSGYDEFERAIEKFIKHTVKNGIILIDLDNKKINGIYKDKVDGNNRIIESNYDNNTHIQTRKITFYIGCKKFETIHKYFIYDPNKVSKILEKYNVKYAMVTNYSKRVFSNDQKRLQIVIKKL